MTLSPGFFGGSMASHVWIPNTDLKRRTKAPPEGMTLIRTLTLTLTPHQTT